MRRPRGLGFSVVLGEVFATQKHSETHLHTTSTGGTSYSGGYAPPPRVNVTSTVITTHEFWIRTPDNRQINVQLVNQNVQLAQGQKIAVVYAARLRKQRYFPVAVFNIDAWQTWTFTNDNYFLYEISGPLKLWAIVVQLALVYNFLHVESLNAFLWAAGFLVYRTGCLIWRLSKAEKRIQQHLTKIMATIGENRAMAPMTLPALER